MKESHLKEDEEGIAQYLDALDLDWHAKEGNEMLAPKSRSGSAPPTFDSSSLFLYMEDDVYTRSFTKGFLNTRKDGAYSEFYEQYKHKNPNIPPPIFQEDLGQGKEVKHGAGKPIVNFIISDNNLDFRNTKTFGNI